MRKASYFTLLRSLFNILMDIFIMMIITPDFHIR